MKSLNKSSVGLYKNSDSNYEICAVILCAGSGTRTGLNYNKILYNIGTVTVLEKTLECFDGAGIDRFILAVSPDDEKNITDIVKPIIKEGVKIDICRGGNTRTQSVKNALDFIDTLYASKIGSDNIDFPHCGIVLIHDGARPFVSLKTIKESITSARKFGSGIAAVKTIDTIKQVSGEIISKTLERETLYNVQTPQTFRFDEIKKAYDAAQGSFTDDSSVYENSGFTARIVEGSYDNIKITSPADLIKFAPRQKIGLGYDVHRLEEGLPLILGGLKIKHSKGLVGHSDADVVTHAIMDALLSAAGLPDIGVLFPNTDNSIKGISSITLLKNVKDKIMQSGYLIGNISAVIIAEKPKLMNHIIGMREILAAELEIMLSQINISCTTSETLGVVGKEQGIAASAVCLLGY